MWLFAVDGSGIKNALTFNGHAEIRRVDFTKEAGPKAFVAGGSTDLSHFEEEGIPIAVKVGGLEFLDVAAFFSLAAPAGFSRKEYNLSKEGSTNE